MASDWNQPPDEQGTESGDDDEDIIPDPILRLRHPASRHSHDSYDSSGMGIGNDMDKVLVYNDMIDWMDGGRILARGLRHICRSCNASW